jgi:hypothetical protein
MDNGKSFRETKNSDIPLVVRCASTPLALAAEQ